MSIAARGMCRASASVRNAVWHSITTSRCQQDCTNATRCGLAKRGWVGGNGGRAGGLGGQGPGRFGVGGVGGFGILQHLIHGFPLWDQNQGTRNEKARASDEALTSRPFSFIRTLTVGFGVAPNLLTLLPQAKLLKEGARGLGFLLASKPLPPVGNS